MIILSNEGKPLMPFILMGEDSIIKVSDNQAVNIRNTPVDEITELVKQKLSSDFSVGSVKVFKEEELLKITVLGDIEEPGNYRLPEKTTLADANLYNNLFDASRFTSSMTLIRKGTRQVISEEKYAQIEPQDGDILMISLERKKVSDLPVKAVAKNTESSSVSNEKLAAEKNKPLGSGALKATVKQSGKGKTTDMKMGKEKKLALQLTSGN